MPELKDMERKKEGKIIEVAVLVPKNIHPSNNETVDF